MGFWAVGIGGWSLGGEALASEAEGTEICEVREGGGEVSTENCFR